MEATANPSVGPAFLLDRIYAGETPLGIAIRAF
jgi:hypothetical protein